MIVQLFAILIFSCRNRNLRRKNQRIFFWKYLLHYIGPIVAWVLVAIGYHFVVKMLDERKEGDVTVLILSILGASFMAIFVVYQTIFHRWIRLE